MTGKPPTPRSVSATLRAADFRARRDDRPEGYEVERSLVYPEAVIVDFEPDWGDESHQAHADGEALRVRALDLMAAALRRKGWAVTLLGRPGRRLPVHSLRLPLDDQLGCRVARSQECRMTTPRPTVYQLWLEAGGETPDYDRDKFIELMRQHGHLLRPVHDKGRPPQPEPEAER